MSWISLHLLLLNALLVSGSGGNGIYLTLQTCDTKSQAQVRKPNFIFAAPISCTNLTILTAMGFGCPPGQPSACDKWDSVRHNWNGKFCLPDFWRQALLHERRGIGRGFICVEVLEDVYVLRNKFKVRVRLPTLMHILSAYKCEKEKCHSEYRSLMYSLIVY